MPPLVDESRPPGGARARPIEAAERDRRAGGCCGSRVVASYLRSRTGHRVGVRRGRQPSIAPRPPLRVRQPVRAPPRRPRAASPTRTTASPSTGPARSRRGPPRRARSPAEAEPGGLAQPPIEPRHRSQLAEQADLADRDGAGRDRPVAERRGEGQRDRQVERRLLDGQAAGEVDVDVVARQADPGPPAEDRDEQRHPVGVDAARGPARRPDRARRDERLDLDEDRPAALERRRDDAAGRRRPSCVGRGTPAPGRRRSARPAAPISNTPTSSVEPNRFFDARSEAERREALALERQDGVDEVLERLRAGERAVLRHVADEDDRDPSDFASSVRRSADSRTWPTLPAGPSSSSTVAVWIESTMRSVGPARPAPAPRSARPPTRRRRGSPVPAGPVEQPEPVGAEPDLGRPTPRRSRTARARAAGRADAGGGLEEERRLADPRLAADEDERARRRARRRGHDRARRSRSGGAARSAPATDVGERGRPPAPRGRRRPDDARAPRLADDGLDEAVPRAAGAALAFPAQEGLTARLADVAALGLRGGSSHAGLPGGGRRSAGFDRGQRLGGVDVEAGLRVLSTTIVVPGSYLPSRRCSARTSSTMFWITRRSGRAPYATS